MVLLSIDWTNLHELLRSLYDEMMPLCEDMASVAKGVAGIGALFYVAYRVWQSLARAEEIDVFPFSGHSCWGFASCSSPLWYWARSTEYFLPCAALLPHWWNGRPLT